jgi:hypothetical protein
MKYVVGNRGASAGIGPTNKQQGTNKGSSKAERDGDHSHVASFKYMFSFSRHGLMGARACDERERAARPRAYAARRTHHNVHTCIY